MELYFRNERESGSKIGRNMLDGRFELPCLVLKRSALDHNIRVMQEFCSRHGVVIAPHVKTTIVPYIIERQVAAGAWGVTVATMQQLRAAFNADKARRGVMEGKAISGSSPWRSEGPWPLLPRW